LTHRIIYFIKKKPICQHLDAAYGFPPWFSAEEKHHFTNQSISAKLSSVMPIIASAIKRVRQQAKRRSHNLQVKRAIHNDVRAYTDAVAAGDTKVIGETLVAAISEIDRAVKKGTLHRNTAGRRKSQLQKIANSVGAETVAPKKAAAKPKSAAKAKTSAKPKPKTKAKPKTAKAS